MGLKVKAKVWLDKVETFYRRNKLLQFINSDLFFHHLHHYYILLLDASTSSSSAMGISAATPPKIKDNKFWSTTSAH